MNRFFDPESFFWKPLGYAADVFLLSCLWTLCCIPVVTIGPAATALYDAAARCVYSRQDPELFGRFFRTLRREFLLSLGTVLLWGGIVAAGYGALRWWSGLAAPTGGAAVWTVAMLIWLSCAVGVGCWAVAILSRFSFGFGGLNATAVKLAAAHPLRTVLLGLATAAACWACVRYVLPLFIVPGLLSLVWAWLIEPVFQTYMHEDP